MERNDSTTCTRSDMKALGHVKIINQRDDDEAVCESVHAVK